MINQNNENEKENINIINKPIKLTNDRPQILIALDKNDDNFVSLKEFISSERSKGPQEPPGGLFKHYAINSLSVNFIDFLIKTKHPIISKIVCLPNLQYCIYFKPNTKFQEIETYISVYDVCTRLPNLNLMYMRPLKSNLILINPPEHTKDYKKQYGTNAYNMIIPDSLKDNLFVCEYQKKSMVFLNLTLMTINDKEIQYQHANIILINIPQKTIERFDPHGSNTFIDISNENGESGESKSESGDNKENIKSNKSEKRIRNLKGVYKQELIDEIIRDKFKSILPDYKYITLNETCPYLGPQVKTDAFRGLCITWSLMYFLLRVLNPNLKQSEINKRMITGHRNDIKDYILRFQRYVIDTLRNAST